MARPAAVARCLRPHRTAGGSTRCERCDVAHARPGSRDVRGEATGASPTAATGVVRVLTARTTRGTPPGVATGASEGLPCPAVRRSRRHRSSGDLPDAGVSAPWILEGDARDATRGIPPGAIAPGRPASPRRLPISAGPSPRGWSTHPGTGAGDGAHLSTAVDGPVDTSVVTCSARLSCRVGPRPPGPHPDRIPRTRSRRGAHLDARSRDPVAAEP